MAKRKNRQKNQQENLVKRRIFFIRLIWVITVIASILFGYSYGYPIVAQGEVVKGILTGLAYGGGAFIAVLISFFLNRKLRGL